MKRTRLFIISLALAVYFASAAAWAGAIVRIYISPGHVILNSRAGQQYSVYGQDANGDNVPVPGPVTWQMVKPNAGSISNTGSFTAGTATGLYADAIKVSAANGMSAVAGVEVVNATATAGYVFEKAWGGWAPGHLNDPEGIAVASNGNVYVADCLNNRVQVFDSNGNYKTQWGCFGTGNGQFHQPSGIAIDRDGNVFVVDSYNYRVQKFSADGAFVAAIGSMSTLMVPRDVAVDPWGNIYVVDASGNKVVKFSSTGAYTTQWGTKGTADGEFDQPMGIAVDAFGNVYVADYMNWRIQKFNSAGTFLTKWSAAGGEEKFMPKKVGVDSAGNVFVGDYYRWRILKFDSSGSPIMQWSPNGRPGGYTFIPNGIAPAQDGSVFVVDYYDHSVQKFDSSGKLLLYFGAMERDKGEFNHPEGIAADPSGNVYVLDNGNNRVQKFEASGSFTTEWGSSGRQDGQFDNPRGIATDLFGHVYVADSWNSRVQKFDDAGKFIAKWGSYGTGDGQFENLWGIGTDAAGNVYATDAYSNRVQKFDPSGNLLVKWGSSEEFKCLQGIGVTPDGTNYVADYLGSKVFKFDANGNLLATLSTFPGGDRPLQYPWSTAVASDGQLIIADSASLVVVNPSGQFVGRIGSYGYGSYGLFSYTYDVEVDALGNIYAMDFHNHRVQKFVPIRKSIASVKRGADGGLVALSGQVVTAGNTQLGNCFYVESKNRSAGIKVTGKTASMNSVQSITGILNTVNGERELQATSIAYEGTATVAPFAMNLLQVGGGKAPYQDSLWGSRWVPGADAGLEKTVFELSGLNNTGLLVRTWGTVKSAEQKTGRFVIDDGKGAELRCNLPLGRTVPVVGKFTTVTGVSSTEVDESGRMVPVLRARSGLDVRQQP